MKIHRWLDFKITRRCNNHQRKCEYCAVPVEPEESPEQMPLEIIQQTLLDARALGFDTFWLLGGEPSLREDISEIFAPLSDDPSIRITIATNGKIYNEEMCYSLFDSSVQRACIQISLDTLSPDNFKRADPAHSLAMISEIKQMGTLMSTPLHVCDVEVHCVISRENWHNFDELVRFFAAKNIGVSLALVCLWKISSTPVRFNEFSHEEMLSICQRIECLNTGLGVDQFNPVVSAFIRYILSESNEKHPRSCGAGLTHLVINGDGDVHRCIAQSFRNQTSLGNIFQERLHRILHNADSPSSCKVNSECFDGFAWDRLALER